MQYSIIIPTLNRAEVLSRTLMSIAQIDFSLSEFEILVVDNGSTDKTPEVFQEAQKTSPKHNWKYVNEPMPGLLSGRHRGVFESQGDICLFIDDDVRLERDWLNAIQEAFQAPDVVLVGGPSRPLFVADPPDWLSDFYVKNEHVRFCGWLSLIDGGDRPKEISPRYVWGLNYAIRKKILIDMGGFNPDLVPNVLQRFQGDGESGLSDKIQQAGLKTLYHPQAAVHHEIPASRLTIEFFKRRAFYQGVCDSYTQIRKEGRVSERTWSWKKSLRRGKRLVANLLRTDDRSTHTVKALTAKAYTKGHNFHQVEVRRDPRLLEWVLRKDYLDYALPSGWQNRMK